MKPTAINSVETEKLLKLLIEMQKDYYRKDEILRLLRDEEKRKELRTYYRRARDFLIKRVRIF